MDLSDLGLEDCTPCEQGETSIKGLWVKKFFCEGASYVEANVQKVKHVNILFCNVLILAKPVKII